MRKHIRTMEELIALQDKAIAALQQALQATQEALAVLQLTRSEYGYQKQMGMGGTYGGTYPNPSYPNPFQNPFSPAKSPYTPYQQPYTVPDSKPSTFTIPSIPNGGWGSAVGGNINGIEWQTVQANKAAAQKAMTQQWHEQYTAYNDYVNEGKKVN